MRGGLVSFDRGTVNYTCDRLRITAAGLGKGACTANHLMIAGGGSLREKMFHAFKHFAGRSRRVYDSTKFAAVPHAMREPARELLHFAESIGQLRSVYLLVVAGK